MDEREPRLPAWMTYRPEGHPISYTLRRPWRVTWYARKYRKKNFLTTRNQLAHFNRQRRLLWLLRSTPLTHVPAGQTVRLAAVGDLMWVRANWKGFLTREVKEHLSGCDALVGNLETPIDSRHPPVEWYKIDAATYNSDPQLLTAFNDPAHGGNIFTALSMANNHVFDRGDDGAVETSRLLTRLGIRQSGLRETVRDAPYVVFERKGIRFGFYAACYGYNDPSYVSRLRLNVLPGLAPSPRSVEQIDLSEVRQVLRQMDRDGVEFRIVYIHWGHEFELYPTAVQQSLGRRLASLGFDLVAGSHPHVLQPSEVCFFNGYDRLLAGKLPRGTEGVDERTGVVLEGAGRRPRKSLIHYSLGNFITAMLFWEPTFGVIQDLWVFRDPDTGAVDWHLPRLALVCNILAIDNRGKKELLLLRPYFIRHRRRIENWYPRNRAAGSYVYRHLTDQMTFEEIRRGPSGRDYERVLELLSRDGALDPCPDWNI